MNALELAQYVAVMSLTERQQAKRAGLSLGGLRVLVRVYVLASTGLWLRAADVLASKAAADGETRRNVKRLLASGHLEREGGPVTGRLLVSATGRQVVAELLRAVERARVAFVSLEPCGPFRRVTPKQQPGQTD